MKINKHFHIKHGKNASTQDRSQMHRACAHTHTEDHMHTVPIKSARASAHTHTHSAEKDMGVGWVKTNLKAGCVIKLIKSKREFQNCAAEKPLLVKILFEEEVLRLVLKAGREAL